MHIKAFLPGSLIEYPGHIADVIYVGECNFRCPYCYNVDLVLRAHRLPDIDASQVLEHLEERRQFVDAVVISGGEPTLQPDLAEFMTRVRRLDVCVKLDTNGYRPRVLQQLLEHELVDYVAMDVKSSFAHYARAAGVAVAAERLLRSIHILLGSAIDYEFRTTVVPGLVTEEDVERIVDLIAGARRYYLQCFRPGETVGWGSGGPSDPPSARLLQKMAEFASSRVGEVGVRGVPKAGDRQCAFGESWM